MAPKGGCGILDQDISFVLDRLFDECNMDHIPQGRRLDGLKKRDLAHIKHYRAAVNIFGGPLSRKRVITAPSMETPMKHRLGIYLNQKPPPDAPVLTSALMEIPQITKPLTKEQLEAKEEEDKISQYKSWMTERKKLRKNLDGMGLTEEYLAKKTDKSELEKRVAYKMEDISREKAELRKRKPNPKLPPVQRDFPEIPKIASPAPVALQIIDEHLKLRKLRLLDLFKVVDKDKNWKATKLEFKQAIKRANLPITDKEVEDMIVCLDDDINDELDYAELSHGIKIWRRERRENRRKSNASIDTLDSTLSRSSGNQRPFTSSRKDGRPVTAHSLSPDDSVPLSPVTPSPEKDGSHRTGSPGGKSHPRTTSARSRSDGGQTSRIQSARGNSPSPEFYDSPIKTADLIGGESFRSGSRGSRCSSPRYLEVPELDTDPGRMIFSSPEAMTDLIKHDKEVLRRNKYRKKHGITADDEPTPGVIKIGDKAIDDHSYQTTLTGEVGLMVDTFRQKRLAEYRQCVKLCKERGVVLSPNLLEKILLYPAEKPYHLIRDTVSQPAEPLITSKFADKPKQVKKSTVVRHSDNVKRTKSGRLLNDIHHTYRRGKQVSQNITKEELSTGTALIRTKVNTWMTFEEYERLTSKHQAKYRHQNRKIDSNAFWPGQLLDKLRLCMPPYNTASQLHPTGPVFTSVRPTRKTNPGFNNDISYWPVSSTGYMQDGSIDKY